MSTFFTRIAHRLVLVALTTIPVTAWPGERPDEAGPTPSDVARTADTYRLLASMAATNLRLRTLYAAFPFDPDANDDPGPLRDRELTTLLQTTRGETDPVVLMLLGDACDMTRTKTLCDVEALARRWVQADTQNQFAWLRLSTVLERGGRVDEANAAFARAADASRWQTHWRELGTVVVRALPKDASIQQRAHVYERSMAFMAVPLIGPWQSISTKCRDAALRRACERILSVAARDADDAVGLNMAYRLSERLGLDASLVRERQRVAYLVRAGAAAREQPLADDGRWDDADSRRVVDALGEILRLGEREASNAALRRAAITDDEAIARETAFRASLKATAERVTSP